eukprot:5296093-Prymnesium_polylepis.1
MSVDGLTRSPPSQEDVFDGEKMRNLMAWVIWRVKELRRTRAGRAPMIPLWTSPSMLEHVPARSSIGRPIWLQ